MGTTAITALLLLENCPGNQGVHPTALCLKYNLVEHYYLLLYSDLHQSYADPVLKKNKVKWHK